MAFSRRAPMLLDNLALVLVKTRFPENIGMAARACANMGCGGMRLVAPERWDMEKAAPLATPKGMAILESIRLFDSIGEAVADASLVFATTARIGGWRRAARSPWQAAERAAGLMAAGARVALVFGPEDRGLENHEIGECQEIVHIRPYGEAASLNLAQAALIMLYECAKAMAGPPPPKAPETISAGERALLERELKGALDDLDCLHGNPDYFFGQWRGILGRAALRRHEFDALMGFCRQLRNRLGKGGKGAFTAPR